MNRSVEDLVKGAVRVAAMSHYGAAAGAVFLAEGTITGKILAESETTGAITEMGRHLASDCTARLLDCVGEGFRGEHNADLEKSMDRGGEERTRRASQPGTRIRRLVR